MKIKKTLIILVASCMLLASIILPSCTARTKDKMSSSTLDITSELSSYNEDELRADFAISKDIELAVNGKSNYSIIIPDKSGEIVIEAAKTLNYYLNQIIGATDYFPVLRESDNTNLNYISIANTETAVDIDTSAIRDDGYIVRSVNENIYLLTAEEESIENAIYGFLEDQLECMFTMPNYDYIPHFPTIYLYDIYTVSNPDFAWRKVFQYEVAQNNWFKKLKNNGAVADDIEKNKSWGTWCHNVFTFVPPDIYMAEHPEYFSSVKGEPRQLCLTNPDVYTIIERKMGELIAEKPEMKYWDFSLNDNRDYCKCKNCDRVLKLTGSMMGTMLPIINKLALKFPDKIISTLAYFDNEQPPKGMICEPNVNIVLAPIVSGQLYSYKFGGNAKAIKTKALLESWGKISQSILIWDYVVDFSHLLLPYPNFDVQKDNHEFYIENNVKAVFHQGSREYNNEMAELRSYILSKQLWDNDINVSKTIAKYLTVTYGKGAANVAKYLDTANSEMKDKAKDLDLYDSPRDHKNDYLSKDNNDKYLALINGAMELEKDNQVIIDRLEKIKINVLYAIMTEDNLLIKRKLNSFDEFKTLVVKHNIKQPYEPSNPSMQDYISTTYPTQIATIRLKISMAVVVPIVILGALFVAIIIINKKRSRRKNAAN